jgi:polysaccharide pyruvyl transferase WcaK-like protein
MTFHRTGAEVEAKHRRYLDAIAGAVRAHREEHPCFPVLVGTSLIDDRSCRMLAERLSSAPVFSAESYDMFETVSLLRCASRIVTSRFHAGVLAMPRGVPFAAVTLDERLRNLLAGFGREDLAIDCGDVDLEDKLKARLRSLVDDGEALRTAQRDHVRQQLREMGRMGQYLARVVKERWPSFPMPARGEAWEEYLPLTDPVLRQLLEESAGSPPPPPAPPRG